MASHDLRNGNYFDGKKKHQRESGHLQGGYIYPESIFSETDSFDFESAIHDARRSYSEETNDENVVRRLIMSSVLSEVLTKTQVGYPSPNLTSEGEYTDEQGVNGVSPQFAESLRKLQSENYLTESDVAYLMERHKGISSPESIKIFERFVREKLADAIKKQ
ncbi:MAG: hypothetical protein KF824_12395 [Fimbriimonadaceae bacterium]|nr:MAG: hypothetical protein KF824_12395 [Fimbriimonadaceae bacterium]